MINIVAYAVVSLSLSIDFIAKKRLINIVNNGIDLAGAYLPHGDCFIE
jgi:hypothetical protein